MKYLTYLVMIGIIAACLPMAVGAAEIGGDEGWYTVYCNVNGASVYFDGEYKGQITNGELSVAVYTAGTPYSSYSVEADGYETYTGSITQVPAAGETVSLDVTLTPDAIGGDKGWYTVYCNVNGASVYFDGTYKGQIANGELSVTVYTTGTPYSSYSVEAQGYETYTASLTDVPTAGETVSLYATLTPIPPTTSIGGDEGWYIVRCNVNGASVYFDGAYKGKIASGELSVAVYTTGTPYSSYSVEADGYETYTGSITQVPVAGETVNLYATLNPVPTAPIIGGDKGWYAVHCNVEGASVYFNDEYKGAISNGVLNVEVYVTGTPYTQYTVEKEGYQTFTSPIDQYPAKGQTVDLYATLDPLPPATTKSPLSPVLACMALGIMGLVCGVFRKP